MKDQASAACLRAAAPGRPKQGSTLSEGRLLYAAIGLSS